MASRVASLEHIGRALSSAGYATEYRELASRPAILAESPYALIACVELSDLLMIEELVSDVQAALTHLAATAPSQRRWDMYLILHLLTPLDPSDLSIVERVEADTRFVRKLVRGPIELGDEQAIDQALRPLLPLRPAADLEFAEPMVLLYDELLSLNTPELIADYAINSFRSTEKVSVP